MWSDLIYRLRSLFMRGSVENDLQDELRLHVELQIEKYVKGGMDRDLAKRRAQVEFGGEQQVKEAAAMLAKLALSRTQFVTCALDAAGSSAIQALLSSWFSRWRWASVSTAPSSASWMRSFCVLSPIPRQNVW